MINLYEFLKARKTGFSTDLFTALYAKKTSGGASPWSTAKETFTSFPQTIYADGNSITVYSIKGKSGGVGEQTINLIDISNRTDIIDNKYISQENGSLVSSNNYYISYPIYLEAGESYTWYKGDETQGDAYMINKPTTGFYDSEDNLISYATHATNTLSYFFTVPENCAYIRQSVFKGSQYTINTMLVKGRYQVMPPYEPYGYKIPVVCGGVTTTLYINSQLGSSDTITYSDTGIAIPTILGSQSFDINTTVKPSKVEITYYGKH